MIVTANRIPVPLPIAPVQEERGQSIQGSHYYSRDNSTWLQEHTHTHTHAHPHIHAHPHTHTHTHTHKVCHDREGSNTQSSECSSCGDITVELVYQALLPVTTHHHLLLLQLLSNLQGKRPSMYIRFIFRATKILYLPDLHDSYNVHGSNTNKQACQTHTPHPHHTHTPTPHHTHTPHPYTHTHIFC